MNREEKRGGESMYVRPTLSQGVDATQSRMKNRANVETVCGGCNEIFKTIGALRYHFRLNKQCQEAHTKKQAAAKAGNDAKMTDAVTRLGQTVTFRQKQGEEQTPQISTSLDAEEAAALSTEEGTSEPIYTDTVPTSINPELMDVCGPKISVLESKKRGAAQRNETGKASSSPVTLPPGSRGTATTQSKDATRTTTAATNAWMNEKLERDSDDNADSFDDDVGGHIDAQEAGVATSPLERAFHSAESDRDLSADEIMEWDAVARNDIMRSSYAISDDDNDNDDDIITDVKEDDEALLQSARSNESIELEKVQQMVKLQMAPPDEEEVAPHELQTDAKKKKSRKRKQENEKTEQKRKRSDKKSSAPSFDTRKMPPKATSSVEKNIPRQNGSVTNKLIVDHQQGSLLGLLESMPDDDEMPQTNTSKEPTDVVAGVTLRSRFDSERMQEEAAERPNQRTSPHVQETLKPALDRIFGAEGTSVPAPSMGPSVLPSMAQALQSAAGLSRCQQRFQEAQILLEQQIQDLQDNTPFVGIHSESIKMTSRTHSLEGIGGHHNNIDKSSTGSRTTSKIIRAVTETLASSKDTYTEEELAALHELHREIFVQMQVRELIDDIIDEGDDLDSIPMLPFSVNKKGKPSHGIEYAL